MTRFSGKPKMRGALSAYLREREDGLAIRITKLGRAHVLASVERRVYFPPKEFPALGRDATRIQKKRGVSGVSLFWLSSPGTTAPHNRWGAFAFADSCVWELTLSVAASGH